MKKGAMFIFSIAGMMACHAFAAVSVSRDTGYVHSLVLEDFGDGSDPATGKQQLVLGSMGGGMAVYDYPANSAPEGYATFNPTETSYDPSAYASIRTRMYVDQNAGGKRIQFYPTPIGDAGMISRGMDSGFFFALYSNGSVPGGMNPGTTLREQQFDLSALSDDGIGLRFDPFNHVNDAVEDHWGVDYFMADRGPTKGAEFDHAGDYMGLTDYHMTSSVSNGVLFGTATGNDAQIHLHSGLDLHNADADVYKYVEIRMKGSGDRVDLFWSTTASDGIQQVILEPAGGDDDYHTYLVDFSEEAGWTGTIDYLRLDPNQTPGKTFEVDYVRLMAASPPVPATSGFSFAIRASDPRFTLWQLPSQGPTQMESYVMKSEHGKVVVIDGGNTVDGYYLKSFLSDLGNHVDRWFITHPHEDHIDALTWILSNPGDLAISNIYASIPPLEWIAQNEPAVTNNVNAFNTALANAGRSYTEVDPGEVFDLDGIHIEILSTKNTDITNNAINNSSMTLKVSGASKSVLFLGDLGLEGGNKLLGNIDHGKLKADYVQMAHHGNYGVTEAFYQVVQPRYGLWPTPLWLWENDQGGGYDTGPWTTMETRQWMDDLNVKSNYVSGLSGLIEIK